MDSGEGKITLLFTPQLKTSCVANSNGIQPMESLPEAKGGKRRPERSVEGCLASRILWPCPGSKFLDRV